MHKMSILPDLYPNSPHDLINVLKLRFEEAKRDRPGQLSFRHLGFSVYALTYTSYHVRILVHSKLSLKSRT